MSSVNKVILVGNLGNDPEVRRTQNGNEVANFSLATSQKWKDRDGQNQEKTEWHKVVVWGKLVQIVSQYLHKGSKVYLEGQLQTRKWQDQSGSDRYSTEVVLQGFNSHLVMLDSRSEAPRQTLTGAARAPQREQAMYDDGLDDEIPF